VLNQCNYVVLDEADRMIDLGFEPQVRHDEGSVLPVITTACSISAAVWCWTRRTA
jgi:superfamily II DNA/RNA helicase